MDRGAARVRLERSLAEVAVLRSDVEAWLAVDRAPNHTSQLAALQSTLLDALGALAAQRPGTDLPEEVFPWCGRLDLRTLWIRRIWDWFRLKLDQREGGAGAVLAAADEVVWSCWRIAFDRLGSRPDRPPPLPFLDAERSPAALPTELVPADLRAGVDVAFFRRTLDRLPVPVLTLPEHCRRAPWWLVFVGHEIGHHLQYALRPDAALVGGFRDRLKEVHPDWGRWSREVFADLFSVHVMGPWAVWAMVEFEYGSPAAMVAPRGTYPPGAVRLALLDRTWRALARGSRAEGAHAPLRGIDPADVLARAGAAAGEVGARLEEVPAVVAAGLEALPGVGETLADLLVFEPDVYARGGTVDRWRDRLLGGGAVPADDALVAARTATAAAVSAWALVCERGSEAQRNQARTHLRDRAVASIAACHPPGDRAPQELPEVDLGAWLLDAALPEEAA